MIMLIIIFILIAIVQYPKLINTESRREVIIFTVFLVFAFVFSILQKIGVEIPSPYSGIEKIVKLFT